MRVEAFIKSLDRSEKLIIAGKPDLLIDRLKSVENSDYGITVFDYKDGSKRKE
jgi:hypothetical protein